MTDKKIFLWTYSLILLQATLFVSTFFMTEDARNILLKEGGIIESLSAAGYFICAIFILYKGRLNYLKSYHYVLMIIIFFLLRELDFDKRFTTEGILSSKFLFSENVPFSEKIIGTVIIAILLYAVFSLIYLNTRQFMAGLKEKSPVSLGILFVIIFLVVSKTLDGLARKLKGLGIEISQTASFYASSIEEILELGIPVMLVLTFSTYFKQTKHYGKREKYSGEYQHYLQPR